MKKKLGLMDVKQALLDARFRESLPQELLLDVQKFLQNPSCGCNHPIYKRVMKVAAKQLLEYYPTREIGDVDALKETGNNWQVINCSINDLQKQLQNLPPGHKQLEIARWQDQVTVVIYYVEE